MQTSLLIVVPTLNSFTLLPSLCRSLLEQSWTGWKVLFVDGPSSAEHRDWLSRLCSSDARFSWIPQDPDFPGIFGAMNQGFVVADDLRFDWLLFWGSDDWAASPSVLADVIDAARNPISSSVQPDIIVCRGRYVSLKSKRLHRSAIFCKPCFMHAFSYRRALWRGLTPPHQCTLFGIRARQNLSAYLSSYLLSADLDYFLRLSLIPELCVQTLDLELVHMSDSGVSSKNTKLRLIEVWSAYFSSFGWKGCYPFFMRYFRRLLGQFFKVDLF